MLDDMAEKLLIDVGDGINMRVVVNAVPGSAAVVIVHGLTSYIHEALYEDARRYFNRKGYSVFRPELYGWEKDARDLKDCTLQVHGQDLDKLLVYLRKQNHKTIFMIGHSYGCPSVMCTSEPFSKAVMWDGTYVGMPLSFLGNMKRLPTQKLSIDSSGMGLILGDEMIKEAVKLKGSTGWIGRLKYPTKFIYAGEGVLYSYRSMQQKRLLDFGIECATQLMPGADHNFTDDKVKDKLFKASYNWFSK